MAKTLPRQLEPLVEEMVPATPVVVIEGGRATGKSTLCDRIIERHGWPKRLDLSDEDTLETLRLDPIRFLSGLPLPCTMDEAQIEPRLLVWVKQVADRRRIPGQFVLTGSARLGRWQLGGSDPLAGRSVRLRLWSMTQGELQGRGSDFLDRAFGGGWPEGNEVASSERPFWIGGLPSIAGVLDGATSPAWEREMAFYVESVLPLGAMGTRADLGRLLRTYRYLAANSAQMLNLARAASELGMQAQTVRSHLDLLEASFLLFRVEAHRPTEHRVVTAHPRVVAADVGLAAWASRSWATSPSASVLGLLTETVVAHDLAAISGAHPSRIVVRHWRDLRKRREVDLVLVHPDGRLAAVEVKASTTVGPADTIGLRAFATEAGSRAQRCIVVYEGNRVINLTPPGQDTEILAVPRSLL